MHSRRYAGFEGARALASALVAAVAVVADAVGVAAVSLCAAGCPSVREACVDAKECGAGGACVAGACVVAVAGVDAGPRACGVGQHDGGDGACVDLTTCSAGFDTFFVDADHDGHGAGPRSTVCVASSAGAPPPGFSSDDSDCDDQNAHAFVLGDFPFDLDNDGFSARISVCSDGTAPLGALANDAFASTPATNPTTAQSVGGANPPWASLERVFTADDAGAVLQLFPFGQAPPVLEVGGFGCGVVPSTSQGMAVRVRASLVAGGQTQLVHLVASVGTEVVAVDAVAVPGTNGFVDIIAGGPGFASAIDPATVCAGQIAVDLAFSLPPVGGANVTVTVDTVTLDLFGVDDCDDADPAHFAQAALYPDSDGDGFGGGTPVDGCLDGAGVPAGFDARSLDCDDADPSVFPGATTSSSSPSLGGIFDYNCDGVDVPDPLSSPNDCVDDGNGGCGPTSSTALTAACGAEVPLQSCGGPPCALAAVTPPPLQACR